MGLLEEKDMTIQTSPNISASAKKSGSWSVLWWVVWIILTIGSFFAASAFWTPIIAKHFGSIRETKAASMWILAVFGTWMVMLLPLIVVMYQKVDKAYDDVRIRREKAALRFRSIYVDTAKRILPENVSEKMIGWPETIEGGHLISVILQDGRRIPHVFIKDRREILGLYNYTSLPFEGKDVTEVEQEDPKEVAYSFTTNWLRMDGVSPT